ncbi:hypothetical protein [Streptomyces sp. NBC_01483]|nr:hypothetical protein [Streptomyces sp. NBC_01483]
MARLVIAESLAGVGIAVVTVGWTFLMTVDWIHQDAHHPERTSP